MKRLLILPFVCCITLAAAQDAVSLPTSKPWRWNFNGGYMFPDRSSGNGGFCLAFEPGYRLSERMIVAVRMEGALAQHIKWVSNLTDPSWNKYHILRSSLSVNTQYIFGSGTLRPFVGAGVGAFHISSDLDPSGFTANWRTNEAAVFGVYSRGGVYYNNFMLMLEYNAIQDAFIDVPWFPKRPVPVSYVAMKVGYSL